MIGIARVGDKAEGICYAHTNPLNVIGTIIEGEDTVLTNNLSTAVVGDSVQFDCGHIGTIQTGSSICTIKDKAVAVIGSVVSGPMTAVITEGSPTISTL